MSRPAYVTFLLFVWISLVYVIIAFADVTAGTFANRFHLIHRGCDAPTIVDTTGYGLWDEYFFEGTTHTAIEPHCALANVEQNGIFPAAATPAATDSMFCSAILHSRKRSGNFL